MAKTPAEMIEAVIRNLPKNTGKTVDEWRAVLNARGPKSSDAQYAWLREKHGLGHVAAQIVTMRLNPYDAPDKLVAAQYAGPRAALRPVYDAVIAAAQKLGADVTPKPCKTYVPIHRTKTFAVVKPERARVTLGLCLDPTTKASGRVEVAKGVGSDRVTHKIALQSVDDVDAEVERWLKRAYREA